MTNTTTARRSATGTKWHQLRRTKLIDEIHGFVDTQRMRRKYTPGWFEDVERTLHEKVMELERELTSEIMAGHDVDAGAIEIEGTAHRRVLRAAQTYVTRRVPSCRRWLYPSETRTKSVTRGIVASASSASLDTESPDRAVCRGAMTPRKPRIVCPSAAYSLEEQSRSPPKIGRTMEQAREHPGRAARLIRWLPDGAVSVALSLDGVLAPIDGGNSPTDVRNAAANEGRVSKGPAGYREVGCATLSFCDAKGEMLGAIRMARTPERNKRTLKASLAQELLAVLRQNPELTVVKVADGVDDNWTYLSHELPRGEEVLDFFHASEHLHEAVAAAYGDGTRDTRHRFEELRDSLRDDDDGVDRVIRAIDYLRKRFPHRDNIRRCAGYFRKHRARMNYAALAKQNLPIGSGVVEARARPSSLSRLKLSGMRWGHGAQALRRRVDKRSLQ